ncbi:MAG TPA: ATP-binding protein [Thermoanaerobaculia bacterium]|nr:ATP-binding protein [Thermoanaerobaculia bacterium]
MVESIARQVSQTRTERLVAVTRVIAHATGALAAVITARQHGSLLPLRLLVPWGVLSAVLLWLTYRRGRLFHPPLLLSLDLAIFAVVVYATGGAGSPFFAFLLITPFGAANLYGRRGMLWAGCGTLATFLLIIIATGHVALDPRLVIVRLGVLILVAAIIIRRADMEQRTNADLENLAEWPRVATADRDAGVCMLLEHAAATLRTPRVVLAWSERDGAEYVARYERGGPFTLDEDRVDGAGIAFRSQTATGRLLAEGMDPDDLRLANIVAQLIGTGLDQMNFVEMMREGVANEERLRLSRDLHDGLLQSLGGLALYVKSGRLDFVLEQLIEAQRSLRDFVDGLRPELLRRRDLLRARLSRVAHSIELQWRVPVQLETSGDVDALDMRRADDVAALVTEALTNAARHAGAKCIRATVAVEDSRVRVDVVDDGHGFPVHGRLDSAHLPWSLRERVTAIGGELAIESSPRGARVEIRLPGGA